MQHQLKVFIDIQDKIKLKLQIRGIGCRLAALSTLTFTLHVQTLHFFPLRHTSALLLKNNLLVNPHFTCVVRSELQRPLKGPSLLPCTQKHVGLSQVSVRIGFDSGRGRWTEVVISGYQELEYFIWRHDAAQKAGVKEEQQPGRRPDERGRVLLL